jgi:hypothetical protein
MVRTLGIASSVVLVVVASATAQSTIEAMPDTHGLDPSSALGCSRGDADACVTTADACTRAGDGSRATVLYRRAADIARHALHVPARPTSAGRVHTVAATIGALEHEWDRDVVRGAGVHGQRAVATAARDQVFGEHAVATWTGRRATIAEAFRAVHTWTLREGGAFAGGVWFGTLRALAADGPCWQLQFAHMNLDFVAFVDDHGRLLAIVHLPEG